MFARLISQWVYGGALAGVLLLIMTPLLVSGWSAPLIATFLHLPAYMLHQLEEHDADRFRTFFNETLGHGSDVLSPLAVFITNVPGVWGVLALALYAAVFHGIGWALIAVYLVLVNAVAHVGHAVRFRRYNPGLISALTLFVPLGVTTMLAINRAGGGTVRAHAIGLSAAVLIHAAILVHVRRTAQTHGTR